MICRDANTQFLTCAVLHLTMTQDLPNARSTLSAHDGRAPSPHQARNEDHAYYQLSGFCNRTLNSCTHTLNLSCNSQAHDICKTWLQYGIASNANHEEHLQSCQ